MTVAAAAEALRSGRSRCINLRATPRTIRAWQVRYPDLAFAWAPPQVKGGKSRVYIERAA